MEFNNFIEHASLCLRTYNLNSQKLKISLAKSNVVFPGTFLGGRCWGGCERI